jgi:hypothetical protein
MAQDAELIQSIPSERIIRIGSPRVSGEIYARKTRQEESNCILFAGSGLQHSDEISLLLESSAYLVEFNSKLQLVYRPHPFGLTSGIISQINEKIKEHKNISLAFDSTDNFAEHFYTKKSFESLNQSIVNSVFVVGTHSTVLVEALLLGRQVIAYSMAEFGVLKGTSVWDNYAHLSRFRRNKNVIEVQSRQEFLNRIIHFEANPSSENLAPEIIQEDNFTYPERLLNALKLTFNSLNQDNL